jgi:hypothetical protein
MLRYLIINVTCIDNMKTSLTNITVIPKVQVIDQPKEGLKNAITAGIDQYFTLYGAEMYPLYQPGQVMMCKELVDWNVIPYGHTFLIETDTMRLVRYVKKSLSPDTLLLVSENPHFEPFEIPKAFVRKLSVIVGSIQRYGI